VATAYQIRVKGQLNPLLSAWFGDFYIMPTPDGDTLMTGIVVDQAALYGVIMRCRDMGITLIAVQPVPDLHIHQSRENTMKTIQTQESHIINARAEAIHAVITDYRVGHQAIVPKPYFSELTIEQGGQGAGTIIRFTATVFGKTDTYHQLITEPEPGRVILETDIETGQYSKFILEPLNNGTQTRVTIFVEFPLSSGIQGIADKLLKPMVSRWLFRQELRNLEAYVLKQAAQPVRQAI
jgi:hypothetical protein